MKLLPASHVFQGCHPAGPHFLDLFDDPRIRLWTGISPRAVPVVAFGERLVRRREDLYESGLRAFRVRRLQPDRCRLFDPLGGQEIALDF